MRITGFSNYEIYPEEGKVWSYKRKSFIGSPNTKGYYTVTMYDDNGVKTHQSLHKLIWLCVNGNIPEGMEINHIDENRGNNSIYNLNLLTHKDNINWGNGNVKRSKTLIDKKHLTKPIVALKDNKIIMLFQSASDAERKGYGKRRCISACCVGREKSYLKYQWKFLDDYLAEWWENEMDKVAC